MTDYRHPLNRLRYFDQLYALNLDYGIMPGLVYLYMPKLAERLRWDDEQKLWFAFLNGMTQNPITSLVMMERLPGVPEREAEIARFEAWFNESWDRLQFDTDRRYQKKDTVAAIRSYVDRVAEHGDQRQMYRERTYPECWEIATSLASFGRLAAFSYLEYVHIMGHGADCDNLMFADKSGSRSHRNGMLLLLGKDRLVWDKRAQNGFDGRYEDFRGLCELLTRKAEEYLAYFRTAHCRPAAGGWATPNISRFTLESNLCTFKNHFFARRYPGVYADMAWERILWAEDRGWVEQAKVFREIREDHLPEWLRQECGADGLTLRERASLFPETGTPYRGEHFLS